MYSAFDGITTDMQNPIHAVQETASVSCYPTKQCINTAVGMRMYSAFDGITTDMQNPIHAVQETASVSCYPTKQCINTAVGMQLLTTS